MEEIKPPEHWQGMWKRVVVVGGGVAGSLVAKSLQFHADVTLIDPKDYFEIPWASLRSMVEPSFAVRSVIYHRDYLTNGRVVVSKAINILNSQVLTGDGRLIAYDYLVIATGHDDRLPQTRSERLEQYKSENEEIKASSSILIVGGGPSGVELASEIAVDFPEKRVTLVHNGSRLLEFIGPKAASKTLEWLKSKKVEVKLQQSIDLDNISVGSKSYLTSRGETIKADCVLVCTGKQPGSAWLSETMLKGSIDGFGRLKVDENLRVKGCKNIFAIGDITDVKELKQGYLGQKHALIVAKNLKLLLTAGGKESKMLVYKPNSVKVIVSLGRHDAVAQHPLTTLIGLVPGLIKSKDLYVGKTRKQLGLDPRQVYLEERRLGFKISGMPVVGGYGNHETPEEWELRRVPAGPNLLHIMGEIQRSQELHENGETLDVQEVSTSLALKINYVNIARFYALTPLV